MALARERLYMQFLSLNPHIVFLQQTVTIMVGSFGHLESVIRLRTAHHSQQMPAKIGWEAGTSGAAC